MVSCCMGPLEGGCFRIRKWRSLFKNAETNYKRAVNDNSRHGSLSEEDKMIVLDAIRFDCDALLTVDRFARDQNKKIYVF